MSRFDVGGDYVSSLPMGSEKAIQYLVSALIEDEKHHKQWHIEQALLALGVTFDDVARDLPDYEIEKGIAP